MDQIQFFAEDIDFPLPNPQCTTAWLQAAIEKEGYTLSHLNIIFGNDAFLHAYNKTYLQHDTFTDIITFDYADIPEQIDGELYISLTRVQENAKALATPWLEELHTVLIHGILHLMGYKDDTPDAKLEMRQKEATHMAYLSPNAYLDRDKDMAIDMNTTTPTDAASN